jgi:hypothetical protein
MTTSANNKITLTPKSSKIKGARSPSVQTARRPTGAVAIQAQELRLPLQSSLALDRAHSLPADFLADDDVVEDSPLLKNRDNSASASIRFPISTVKRRIAIAEGELPENLGLRSSNYRRV